MSDLKRIICTVISDLLGPDPVEVITDNRDRIAWELSRSRERWPKPEEAPTLWATFIAWHALKRTGRLTCDFDSFNTQTSDVQATAEDVDPTRTAPAVA